MRIPTAFQLMKYLHFVRDGWYPNVPVDKGASSKADDAEEYLIEELLEYYRRF